MMCLFSIRFNLNSKSSHLAVLLCLLVFIRFSLEGESPDYLNIQTRIQEIFETSKSSVVRVKATREIVSDGKTRRILKMGSGFFVSKDGQVLTTGLLKDPDRIWVEHMGSFYLAEKLGQDILCNLSLLKLETTPKSFSFVTLSDFPEESKVGSILVALTCALEFDVGPTFGILQSEEFSFGKRLFPTKMLRTSLALGPGEIGAPVFDLRGKFVGISHAGLPDLKSSFLLPANACMRIREALTFSGGVDYGWFGITTTRQLNDTSGFDIVVQNLIDESPAAESLIKSGDIIRKVGNRLVNHQGDLAHAAFFSRPNTFVEFLVIRGGKEIKIPIKVAKRPSFSNDVADMEDSILEDGSDSHSPANGNDSNQTSPF